MFKGRKRLRFTGRTKGFVMALLMTALFALPMGAGAEEIGGIVYAFDEEAKTAAVTDIVDLAAPGKVTIPAQVEKDGVSYSVTALKWLWNASEQRANITGLVIPNTVTSADVNFRKFPNMTSATIPGSVKKFNGSFQFMTKLSGIVFGEGVEEIGSNLMVTDCSVLVSVKLPSTLKALTGPGIFSGAPWLGYYNPVELPEGITEIPDMTFRNCKYMKGVTAKGKITKIGQSAFSGCSNISTIPELGNVTEMGINAFKDCSKLEGEVDLSSLKEVPDSAFHFAHITGVKLSDQLEKVGANAFNSCRFTAVDLPSSLREIGSYAFCYARLNEITLPEGLETIGTGAYYGCKYDLSGTLEIPDSVTKIGADAFKGSTLDEIVVGKGVMEIGKNAFADMPNLSKVTIDNSPDIVHTSGAGWTDGVEVIYTIEGVGDVGDTIAEGGLTLQEAVNQSSPGDTIELKKPIKLSSTLNIPADKDVTICVKDENGLLMLANEEAGKKIEDMISVEAGAKLTLAGNLTISAINSTDSIIESSGAVTIEEGVTLSRAKITEMYSGVVDMKGAEAVLTINGGTIADNQLNNTFGGTVRATDGAQVCMKGGVICNNQCTGGSPSSCSPGILMFGNSVGQMTGGKISDNLGQRGSALMLYGINAGGQAVFTLDGGTIENNVSKSFDGKDASGAVNVEGNAALTMNGGAIRNNRCGDGMPGVKGYVGGGVCVVDAYENEKPTTNASFTMNGGSIIGNSAGSGGGIYSFSNNVHLNGGLIAGNTASMNGGGVYSEGCPGIGYSTLYMKNALIVDNAAVGPDGQGGGMWFCPTGDGVVYEVEGAAIYSNRADGAGDDFASVRWADREFTVTLPNVIPGGSGVEWYVDGGVTISSGSGDVQAGIDGNIPRYRPHSGAKPVTIENCTSSVALKAVTELDPEGLADELAHMGFAKLIIADNQAEYGGGVGANGGIVVGRELKKPVRVGVRKAWNGTPDEYAKAIRVKLYAAWNDGARSGYPVAYGELNADNEWNYTFENIPYMEEDLQALGLTDDQIKNWENFFVVEVLGEGLPEFDEECGKIEKVSDEEDLFEIHLTNTMKSGTLILHKDILGEFNGTDKEKVEENLSFTVTGPYGFERVIPYSSFTNGTYTLENVPVGEYTVTESGEELADYSVKTAIVGNPATVPENGKAEVSFTNTYMPDHPETDITIIKRWEGDTPFMRPDEIHIKIGAKNDPGYTDNRTLTAAEDQVSEDEWRHKYYGWWIRDYVITEVNVPAHYTSSVEQVDEHTFVITNTYMPQTGDGSHPALYAAMTALAGAVLLALRKRRAA